LHRYLKLKSLVLLAALFAGFVTPLITVTAAQAQSGRQNVHRQNVNRPHARPHHRPHTRPNTRPHHRPVTRPPHHRPPHNVRHRPRHNVVVVHPRRHWNRGGAIAAGAAIGFIAGAAAASWAGPPPRSGYCWYYTNRARTHGFWDWCPR
jgi:Ni/Co efflux regulator RcnB